MSVISEVLTFHEARRFTDQELTAYVAPRQSPSVFGLIGSAESYPGGSFSRVYPGIWTNDTTTQFISEDIGKYWYNRIHITPSSISLGNLLSAQSTSVEVWNAFFVPQTLDAVTENNTEGMVLTEPSAPPTTFTPLESKEYLVSVGVSGPSTIDGVFSFDFAVYSVVLSVTGKRVVVWPFTPQSDLLESVEFKTDILTTKAAEQRIALRTQPRVGYQGTFFLDETNFSFVKAVMSQWGHRKFAFPLWPEATFVGALSFGTSSISVDTTRTSYVAGAPVVIYQTSALYEAAEVSSLTASSLELKHPLVNGYTGAYVLPAAFAVADGGVSVERGASQQLVGRALFLSTSTVDLSADTGKSQLRGADLYLDRNMVVSSVAETLYTDVEVLDNSFGVRVLMPQRDFSEHKQVLSFDCQTRDQLWEAKQWLYSLKGRQKSFFLPSWNRDLIPVSDLTGADTTLLVHSINYHLYYAEKDIIFFLSDGTYLVKQATAGSDAGGGLESITLDSSIGQEIPLSDLDRICFLSHVRLDSDRFEVHYTGSGATIVVPVKEVPE